MPTAAHDLEHLTTSPVSRKIYPRPPVFEAVIDIQVDPADVPDVAVLQRVYAGFEEQYLPPDQIISAQVQLAMNASGSHGAASSSEALGYRLVSRDHSSVLQVRRNGMAFSRLRPYSQWEEWAPSAREWWSRYVGVTQPKMAVRVAVRYINRIDIPSNSIELPDYFTVYPATPGNLEMHGFALRLELPQEDIGSVAIVQQGPVLGPVPNAISIVLDIDLFQVASLPPVGEAIWERLENLHSRENDLFESFITPRTRALFG